MCYSIQKIMFVQSKQPVNKKVTYLIQWKYNFFYSRIVQMRKIVADNRNVFKQIFLLFLLLTMFSACVSNNAERYDDWKYMGFGIEIPEWYEYALRKNLNQLQKMIPEVNSKKDIIILKTCGKNLDLSEKKLQELEKQISDDFVLYDDFWTKYSSNSKEPFVSIAIYIRKQ